MAFLVLRSFNQHKKAQTKKGNKTMENDRIAPTSFGEYWKGTKESIKVFRWIFGRVMTPASKRYLKLLIACSVIAITMQTIQPAAVGYLAKGLDGHDENLAKMAFVVFLVALFLQKAIQWGFDRHRQRIYGIHAGNIDSVVTLEFNSKSLAQHSEHSGLLAPAVIEKGKAKAMDLQRIIFFDALPVSLNLVLSIAGLFFISWTVGLVMLVILLLYGAWTLYLNSEVGRVYIPIDRDFRRLARKRHERFEHVERLKVTGMHHREVREMAETYDGIKDRDQTFWFWFFNVALGRSFLSTLGLLVVVAWSSWLVWNGKLNIGMFFPLVTWATQVTQNIWRLGDVEHNINWNLPPVQSMIRALSIEPAIVDKPDAVEMDHEAAHTIEFHHVSHEYASGDADALPAIQDVSFVIRPGEKVAVLGPSGAGKSTLMRLLLRHFDPSTGAIRIGGVDLRDITQESWARCVGYIPQQSAVFDGTLRYNLTFGLSDERRESITDAELEELMGLLKINFGKRLTHGLDTVVGRNGMKLSGGQQQRLMIGAAVIANPWLLVIDEATSSLDSETEREVQEGLETILNAGTTSALIVAHRLSTVRHLCTQFVVLRPMDDVLPGQSQIEAVAGSFEELYKISPTFKRLADAQGVRVEERAAA